MMVSAQANPVVFIIFYSRCGSTEKLAAAAAVGAVQERANIRLRRLSDTTASIEFESAECQENFTRMRKEYVPPTEADIVAADAVIFAAPAAFERASAEWTSLLDLLARMRSEGKLRDKVAAAIAGSESARAALSIAVLEAGFIVAPAIDGGNDVDHALQLGKRVASVARARKV